MNPMDTITGTQNLTSVCSVYTRVSHPAHQLATRHVQESAIIIINNNTITFMYFLLNMRVKNCLLKLICSNQVCM